jgi:hypothetical protein
VHYQNHPHPEVTCCPITHMCTQAQRKLWVDRQEAHNRFHSDQRYKWESARVAGRDRECNFRIKHTDGIDCNNLAIPIQHKGMYPIDGYKIKLKQQVFMCEGVFNMVFLVWPWVKSDANMVCTCLHASMLRERCVWLSMSLLSLAPIS